MNSIQFDLRSDGIVHLTLDNPTASSNLMNRAFTQDFLDLVETLKAVEFKGVVITSAKKTFFAGGDLKELIEINDDNAAESYHGTQKLKQAMRWLETCGKPVVACINGAALGGGWELALHAQHRIALKQGVVIGLPEVTLGLLPGGGGVVRMTRLMGLQNAMPYLLQGKQIKSAKAHELGLIHALADSAEEMFEQAISYINSAELPAAQPYDVKGYKVPGGTPSHPSMAMMLPIAPAMLRAQTKGVMPAPDAILAVMVESLQVDVDAALRIESRYFIELAKGNVARNMISAFWFQLNEIKAGASRPSGYEATQFKRVGILGAGMMGAGIAYAAATKGVEVVLFDVNQEAADKGKGYSEKLMAKRLSRGRATEEKVAQVLERITATDDVAAMQGVDLVIEAVFEDRNVKADVTKRVLEQTGDGIVFASNTSTLPITGLAQASSRPDRFVGMHFFSPVDKMPLVELIRGEQTSDETLAAAYDFVMQIAKTPIVVNDSRGFFTSRVFGTYTKEGMKMLAEGVPAAMIENAAYESGFPVGPLAVTDEVSLTLVDRVRTQTIKDAEAAGQTYPRGLNDDVIDFMLAQNRAGKAAGAGFYEYVDGKKKLWPGLDEQFGNSPIDFTDVKERLLFIQAIETVKCIDENVIMAVRDANLGSIMGIGFPPWTGGVMQYINQYGLREFVSRAEQLAAKYGDDFNVPASLVERAEMNKEFSDES